MMEIKVQCNCGQRFKFDVEPVNGQMPFAVTCPVCGADGTATANEILRQIAATSAAPSLPSPPPAPQPAIRVRATIPAVPAATAHLTVAAPPPPAVPGPLVLPAAPVPIVKPGKPSNFGLGLLGASIGSLVGGLIYFVIFNYTGLRLSLIAIAVGYLSGAGAEVLGRKEGSKQLGMIAALLAISAVLGAQYMVARNIWNKAMKTGMDTVYEMHYSAALALVKAIPTGSDDEIRIYLAKENSGVGADPKSIADEQVSEFRKNVLPMHQDLASGKITREYYEKNFDKLIPDTKKLMDTAEGDFKTIYMMLTLTWFNIISMILTAGVAFRTCANA